MLAKIHEQEHSGITKKDRLRCINQTLNSLTHLKNSLRARIKKELSIPESDVEKAIEQIIEFPFLGGRKGVLKLIEDKKGLIGETFYKEIKQILKPLSESIYSKRNNVKISPD